MAGVLARLSQGGRPRRAIVIASFLAACTADNAGPSKGVASVAVSPPTAPLPVGTTLQLTATPEDAQGNPLTNRSVTWSSSDTTIATVSSSGVASGVSLGLATITARVDGVAGTASVTVTSGPAVQLSFAPLSGAVVAGVALAPPVVVTARDVGGNVATGFSGLVTVAFGTNPAGGTLLGTATVAASGGVATFADLRIDKSGSGYTFQATSGTLPASTSVPVTVSPGPAAKLAFAVQPSAVVAGAVVAPAVQVVATDQFGNGVPSFADSVDMAIGTNPGGGTLSGTRRVLPVNGVASFADLSVDRAAAGYTLIASTATLTAATSLDFIVGPATPSATMSTITASPTTITSSTGSSAAAIAVTVRDAFGNPVPGVGVTLTATGTGNALVQPTGPTNAAGVTQGTLSATVSEVKIVSAKAGGLTLAETDTVTVNPAVGGALYFSGEPSSTVAGSAISPSVVVTAKDPFGNVSTTFSGVVTLGILDNSGGGTLGGTVAKAATAGVVTFSDLEIDKAGSGYTLGATATGMTAGKSAAFNITAGPVSGSRTTVAVSPAAIPASSGTSTATVTITVRDGLGNPIPGVPVAFTASGAGNMLAQPVAPSNAAGVAIGSLSSTAAGAKVIAVTAGGVPVAQTDTVAVTSASTGAVSFTVPPSAAVDGVVITPAVVVTAKDSFNNVITGFTGTVTVAIGDNPGGGTLGGTLSKAASAGVATFSDLTVDKPGTGYSLKATTPGLAGTTSGPFTISAGPVSASQTTVSVSPATITASSGSSMSIITVTARDASGNPIPGASVVLTATGAGDSLTPPAGVTTAAGVASGSLSSTVAGTKTITATVNGTPITQQPTVVVSAAAPSAAQTTIAAAPASIAASDGGVISTITVMAKDAFGNPVSGVTVALAASGSANTLVQPAVTTNASGIATGTVSSSLVGAKTISATVNGAPVNATTTVTIVPGDVSVSRSSLIESAGRITASAGASIDTFTVIARDDQGNVIPGTDVVLTASGTTNVVGQPAVTDTAGVARGTLRSTVAQTETMTATIAGSEIDQVDTIIVLPGAASVLAFAVQPTSAIVGVPISPAVQVEIRDAFANRVTSASNAVALALNLNPGSLSGNGPIAANNGVATFASLAVGTAATGYTLTASSAGLTPAVSGPFNVSTAVVSAAQSSVTVSPGSIVAGSGTAAITVTARNASGVVLPGVTVTLAASGSNTLVQPSGLTDATGVTSGALRSTSAGVKTVTATANGVVINQKPAVTVMAGPISSTQSTVQANPASIVASTGTSTITVVATDDFGNPVSGATVTLGATGSDITLTQPTAVTDATGVATGSVKASDAGTVAVSATAGGVLLGDTASVTVTPPGESVVFIGAGDISDCGNLNDGATAALITALPSATVFTLGDNAYPHGTTSDYTNCYDPTWGAFKSRTHPSAGNKEYDTSTNAAPYFAYFGAAAGPSGLGYYSFDLGSWHIIVLNSNIATDLGSPQEVWLKNDLSTHPSLCTLAYWHHPLYSSVGGTNGTSGAVITTSRPFWDDLYAAGAELVLNGHRHDYERLAPMAPDGSPDSVKGIRTIIAGTGGESGGDLTNIFPTSEVRDGRTFGILKVTLSTGSYSWQFIGVPGSTFADSGSAACH